MDPILRLEYEEAHQKEALKGLLATAKAEKRSLTDEEREKVGEIEQKLEATSSKLRAERKQLEIDRHAKPIAWPGQTFEEPGQADAPLSYRSLFGDPRPAEQFSKAEEFYQAVGSGRYHPGLIRATMLEGLGSEGGFLVPDELTAEAFDSAVEESVFLPRARVYPMQSESRSVAGFTADGSATYGPYGTWAPSWVAEGGTITASNPTVRKVTLFSRKLALYISVSNELLADGLTFSEQLGRSMRKALAWALDYAIAQGTGAGQPTGVLACPATVTVSKEGGQAADSFVGANALNMYSRMLPGSHRNAAWYVHPTVLPQLYAMTVVAGVAGQAMGGLPGYFDASGMTLFGRPVYVTEKLPVLGDLGDVLFADMNYYAVGIRREITLDASNGPGFQTDTMAYRGIVRADGKGLLATAYTPKSGDALSPFVVCEAR